MEAEERPLVGPVPTQKEPRGRDRLEDSFLRPCSKHLGQHCRMGPVPGLAHSATRRDADVAPKHLKWGGRDQGTDVFLSLNCEAWVTATQRAVPT